MGEHEARTIRASIAFVDMQSCTHPAWHEDPLGLLHVILINPTHPPNPRMALLAFSRQLDAECVLSSEDPLAKEAVAVLDSADPQSWQPNPCEI